MMRTAPSFNYMLRSDKSVFLEEALQSKDVRPMLFNARDFTFTPLT